MKEPILIAHRGIFDNQVIPENSLAAFRKARDYHFPIELDVSLTKDGVLVVFHDKKLQRMCGVDKNIEDCTFSELENYFLLSTKEHIPTLKEVLSLINGDVLIDIEIKKTKNVSLICQKILECIENYSGVLIFKSFQISIVRYLKKHTSLTTGYLIGKKRYSLVTYFFSNALLIRYTRADFLAAEKCFVQKARFQKYRRRLPLFIWTLSSKEELRLYSSWADAFLCNSLPY